MEEALQGGQPQPRKKGWGKRAIFLVIMVAASILLGISIYNIVAITSEDSANEHTMQAMREFVTLSSGDATDGADFAEGAGAEQPGEAPLSELDQRSINFAALQQVNPEIVAWLYIPGTNVDYPVTRTDNNEYYLSHGPDLAENRAGSIFFEASSSPALTDTNTIIYGHRMNNGSMFGSLYSYEDPEFFNEHRMVYLYTPDGKRHDYQLFDVLHSSDSMDSPPYLMNFDTEEDFIANCLDMMDASIVPVTDVSFSPGDRILTLSTCVRGDGATRLILQAKEVSQTQL